MFLRKIIAFVLLFSFLGIFGHADQLSRPSYLTILMEPYFVDYDQQRRILYLDQEQREGHRIHFRNGRLFWPSGQAVNVDLSDPFVMDAKGELYIVDTMILPPRSLIRHSTLLAGSPVAAAGGMRVENGYIILIVNSSGHYALPFGMLIQLQDSLARRGVYVEDSAFTPFQGNETLDTVNFKATKKRIAQLNKERLTCNRALITVAAGQ